MKNPESKDTAQTRHQRRESERRNKEAQTVYNQLTNKFLAFLIQAENPESAEVIEKRKQVNAQWRLYCNRSNLLPIANEMFNKFADKVMEDYIAAKK